MSTKSLIRFAIGLVVALLLLCVLLPLIGIPRSQIFPPSYGYSSATGHAKGRVTRKESLPTGNPFKVADGEKWDWVTYTFTAKAGRSLPLPGNKPAPEGTQTQFTGTVKVRSDSYSTFKEGATVPIKYDVTYPVINGIDAPEGGRSGGPGSALLSGWILWALVTIGLGYLIAGALERLLLRESY